MTFRFCTLFVLALSTASASEYRFFREDVLGTSMELCVQAESRSHAEAAERLALKEISRLRSILSSYEADSEISQFVKSPVGTRVAISPELLEVLQACDEWNRASRGAFNVGTEPISAVWKEAGQANRLPATDKLRAAVQLARRQHWELNLTDGTAVRLSACPLSLNAIAKGYILDRTAHTVLKRAEAVSGVMLNIGGDIRVLGSMNSKVAVADPQHDAIGGSLLAELDVSEGAIATSGGSERSFEIGGAQYSHIIDPRSGQPVKETVSATVLAPNATTADALATICSVLSVRESLAIVNSMSQVECLIVSANGTVASSNNWPQEKKPRDEKKETKKKPAAKPTGHEMLVEFEIARPANSRRYRRPYVAVWVEDESKFPVKTLSLFVMQNNPGPRWYRDVRRWYLDDQVRKLTDSTDMIKAVSKPTRNPGKYKVTWDGRDDTGKVLKPGKYTLLIESAREHGSYKLIKKEFEFGKAVKQKLKGNTEISAAAMTYAVKDVAKQTKDRKQDRKPNQ